MALSSYFTWEESAIRQNFKSAQLTMRRFVSPTTKTILIYIYNFAFARAVSRMNDCTQSAS